MGKELTGTGRLIVDSGKLIKHQRSGNFEKTKLDVRDLPRGFYVLRMYADIGVLSSK